jgi:diguanylate cyclase (GGDEF)-like protein
VTYAAATAAHVRWTHHDDQVALRDQLSALADCDGLTGLLNHRAFHEHLRAAGDRATATTDMAVLMLDLDHFKAVNDCHGHVVGDGVLRAVTAAILASIRADDVAARLGGEEFAVLLPDATPEVAGEVAERVRQAVGAIVDPVPVTASIGLSCGRGDTSGADLLERADGALYAAKRQGRNRVCWLQVA